MPRGKLTDTQIKYTELVAGGMNETLAVVEAGYSPDKKRQALYKLRRNERVQGRIKMLKENINKKNIATREEREIFWTCL